MRQTIRLRLVLHSLSHATHPDPQTDHAKHYIMNLINPVRESEISSAIDVTTQMDFEEASAKRKLSKDNHSPRPGHPRYSDLFDQPCSGAPIVIHLISKPKSFQLLGISEKLAFMNALTDTIGQVKAGTKWTHQGYLNVYPTSSLQKRKLLELKVLKQFEIKCNLAMSEASLRGVIRNVPTQDSEEDILSLLAEQGVTKVQRFTTPALDGSRTPLKTVTLFFKTSQLPREVIMAHEIFPVKQFIPRPALCRKCWTFGHPEETCTSPPTCKQCSQTHPPSDPCKTPPKCPTCAKPGHAAGTLDCPKYNNRQQIIKFAYENRIPIAEASKLLSNPEPARPPQLPRMLHTANPDQEMDDLKKEVAKLRSQIETEDSKP